jgi:hypothetical protein
MTAYGWPSSQPPRISAGRYPFPYDYWVTKLMGAPTLVQKFHDAITV